MSDQITKSMITAWISHPITQKMLALVKDRLEADREHITGLVINGPSIDKLDLHIVSQLKGQILAYEAVIDTKDFLMELTEEEVADDVKSSGA